MRRGGLAARIGNPLSWNLANRCLTLSAIMLGCTVIFVAAVQLGDGWPIVRVDPGAHLLPRLSPIVAAVWSALVAWSLWARRSAPDSRVLSHVVAQAFSLSVGLFTCAVGPFQSPGWIGFLGGAIVGYLALGKRAAQLGVVTYLAVTFGGAWAIETQRIELVNKIMPSSARTGLPAVELYRLGITSLVLALLTLTIAAYIIDRWRDREARYQRLARTDALTGLTNRRKFLESCERELARARRYDSPMAVVVLDLDHFKRVNDTYGHLAGDQVLVATAKVLQAAIRDADTAARTGGEEFAVLLPATDRAGAQEMAERCARRLAETTVDLGGGASARVTASFGVAELDPKRDKRLEDLLRRADEALYAAKEAGRNRVTIAA